MTHRHPSEDVHFGFGISGIWSRLQTMSCSFLHSAHGPSVDPNIQAPVTTLLRRQNSRFHRTEAKLRSVPMSRLASTDTEEFGASPSIAAPAIIE